MVQSTSDNSEDTDMDIAVGWESLKRKRVVGRPISVWQMDSQITGTISEVRDGEPGIIKILLSHPQRRRRFSGDAFGPAIFDTLLIDTRASKLFEIDTGTRLYLTLPRADHAIIG